MSTDGEKSKRKTIYESPQLIRLTAPNAAWAQCAPGSGDTVDCVPGSSARWCTVTGSTATSCGDTGSSAVSICSAGSGR